jgi:hypothetical protein
VSDAVFFCQALTMSPSRAEPRHQRRGRVVAWLSVGLLAVVTVSSCTSTSQHAAEQSHPAAARASAPTAKRYYQVLNWDLISEHGNRLTILPYRCPSQRPVAPKVTETATTVTIAAIGVSGSDLCEAMALLDTRQEVLLEQPLGNRTLIHAPAGPGWTA